MLILKNPNPKVIFMDAKYYPQFQNNHNTIFLPFTIEELTYYQYTDMCDQQPYHNEKDNLLYMMLQNEKPEFLRRAINFNHFGTKHFIWIDFGIKCNVEIIPDFFPMYEDIRIGSIWDLKQKGSCLNSVLWFFAGSVFGGDEDSLINFSHKCRVKCLDIIKRYHMLTWEVNVWKMIYDEHPYLFSPYPCGFDQSILSNY
jgi:hypothetical protein